MLLPLRDNSGRPYPPQLFAEINDTLVEAFGGVTAFLRAPAKGTWVNRDREERDDVIVVEVMADRIDQSWWKNLRARLERDMGQAEIVIRCHPIERL